MNIVYYPDIIVSSEATLKTLLLFWYKVNTIVPLSEKFRIDAYFEKNTPDWQDPFLERYKAVLNAAGEPILDFITITEKDKEHAGNAMFDLVSEWNKDSKFYNLLKVYGDSRYHNSQLETFSVFEDKLESHLRELLLSENLLIRNNRQLMGVPQISKSYMSLLAREIKKNHNVGIITDDEFCLALKTNAGLVPIKTENDLVNGYQVVAIDVPQIFISPKTIKDLSWKQIIRIRKDLLPFSQQYYTEIEKYQNSINMLQKQHKVQESIELLREFGERLATSFKPFSKEISSILGITNVIKSTGLITDIVIPTMMLFNPEFNRFYAIASLAITSTKYLVPKPPAKGFDYLINLNKSLRLTRLKNSITRLIPKH